MWDMKKNNGINVSFIIFIFVISFLYRFSIPYFYPAALRADEIFQTLEPAHRLLTGHGVTTWEWQAGIRNWLFPDMIAGVWRVTDALGLGHSPLWIQGILCVLSLGLVAVFMALGAIVAGRTGLVACGLVGALWPDLVLGASRTTTEVLGGNLLALGTLLGVVAHALPSAGAFTVSWRRSYDVALYGAAAFFVGCGAGLRFQLMPAGLLALAWMAWWLRRRPAVVALMAAASALPVAGYGLVDLHTSGTFFGSVFRNVHANIGQNIAATYGTAPFYFYIVDLLGRWQVGFAIVAFFFLRGCRQFPMPSAVAGIIILSHSVIGHKEPSFIYGAIPLLLAVAAMRFGEWMDHVPVLRPGHWAMMGLAIVSLSGFVQQNYLARIRNSNALIHLQQVAARQKDLCGLAFPVRGEWAHTGGYSYFSRRDVPIYFADDGPSLAALSGGYNYIITYGRAWSSPPEDSAIACRREFCLFRVAPACTAPPDYDQFSQGMTIYESRIHQGIGKL